MKLYFAGGFTTTDRELALVHIAGVRWRLISFADVDSWAKEAFVYWTGPDRPERFFLDSGAFSAHTRGHVIDLDRYCDFIKGIEAHVHPVACLDVIGDWRGSAHNYDLMRAKGVDVMPTYHMGSPDHELRRLLKDADYLALGGIVGATRETMQPWLDKCFRTIHDFWPKKIHAFGVMAQWALERYPFYSADSSSALVGAGMGRVSTFDGGKVSASPWPEFARRYQEGMVVDGLSIYSAKAGVRSAHRGRSVLNVQVQLKLQRHITDLWAMRGITWEDQVCAASTAPLVTT